MNLVIVESGAKAKKIAKDLNSSKVLAPLGKFIVSACFGHIRDLTKKDLGIDIPNQFKPIFNISPDKTKTVVELQEQCNKCNAIWIASDPDLEGEAIADSLVAVLKIKEYHRVTFNEINQAALERAFLQPRKIHQDMVDAQLTRRMVDRLVGFQISPLLWKKFDYKHYQALSAGRVQSATLHLCIDKEKEIASFERKPQWEFQGKFSLTDKDGMEQTMEGKKDNTLSLCNADGSLYKITTNKEDVHTFFSSLQNKFYIEDISTKTSKEYPKAPYITSTLQQDAHTRLKFSVDKTMKIAQALYEAGHITYLRTDSFHMSETFAESVREYITTHYGEEYVSETIAKKKAAKNAQEAHECIRVTHLDVRVLDDEEKDMNALYQMIYARTLTCVMTPTIYDELHMSIMDRSWKDLSFHAMTKKVKFNGFQVVYDVKNETNDFAAQMERMKQWNVSCETIVAKCGFTQPDSRFSEATLIKALESEGIGRPSTYATIMNKLKEKNYLVCKHIEGTKVEVCNVVFTPHKTKKPTCKEKATTIIVGAEKDRLVPTDIGKEVDAFLSTDFSYILDKKFTAELESKLDRVEKGEAKRLDVLSAFWNTLEPLISKTQADMPTQERKGGKIEDKVIEGTDITYFLSKKGYVLKKGEKVAFLPTETDILSLSAEDANVLFSWPKVLGSHEGEIISLQKGQYGVYFTFKGKNITVKDYSESFTLADACKLLEGKNEKVIKEWSSIGIYHGPYGPYIKSGKQLCSLPKEISVEKAKELKEKEVKELLKIGLEAKKEVTKRKV